MNCLVIKFKLVNTDDCCIEIYTLYAVSYLAVEFGFRVRDNAIITLSSAVVDNFCICAIFIKARKVTFV